MAKFYILVFIIYSAIFVTSEEEKEVNYEKKCKGENTVPKECFDKFTQQDKDAGNYCCITKYKKKDGIEGSECTLLNKEELNQLSEIEKIFIGDGTQFEEVHIICEETSSNSNYLQLRIFSLLLLILL